MATPKETLWELDPHTTAKHEILRRYLAAWFPILGTYHGRIVYIDGFSGPGRYKSGEPGSPLIALDVAVNHRKSTTGEIAFWFIEERDDRLAHLKQELAAVRIPAHFKVTADSGRFHEKFGSVLSSIEADKNALAPTFAFIDPFGFSGIPFSLIERLLKHKRCEVFITFMVDAINRFLEHPEDKVVSTSSMRSAAPRPWRSPRALAIASSSCANSTSRSSPGLRSTCASSRCVTARIDLSTTCSSRPTTSWATSR